MYLNSQRNYLAMTYKKQFQRFVPIRKYLIREIISNKNYASNTKNLNDSQNTGRANTEGTKTSKRIKVSNTARNIKTSCCNTEGNQRNLFSK